jgi:hypothetical protein
MRNIFHHSDQPENKVTHDLVSVLGREPKLLVGFLR